MTSTMVQTPIGPRFDWRPSADEVAAIVAELRPLITALATEERRRLDQLVGHL
jgi:hypothetical protein